MISEKIEIADFHKISYFLVSVDTLIVGMTGFEPATPRPPGVYATRLRHIPNYVISRSPASLWFFDPQKIPVVQFILSLVKGHIPIYIKASL